MLSRCHVIPSSNLAVKAAAKLQVSRNVSEPLSEWDNTASKFIRGYFSEREEFFFSNDVQTGHSSGERQAETEGDRSPPSSVQLRALA